MESVCFILGAFGFYTVLKLLAAHVETCLVVFIDNCECADVRNADKGLALKSWWSAARVAEFFMAFRAIDRLQLLVAGGRHSSKRHLLCTC